MLNNEIRNVIAIALSLQPKTTGMLENIVAVPIVKTNNEMSIKIIILLSFFLSFRLYLFIFFIKFFF
jgi:hypothetical protein